jgi:hypothetical protein
VRPKLSKRLGVTGALCMVAGLVVTIVMLAASTHCLHQSPDYPDIGSLPACAGYQHGADGGYGLLVIGAVLIVLSGLSQTALVQGGPTAQRGEQPEGEPTTETG